MNGQRPSQPDRGAARSASSESAGDDRLVARLLGECAEPAPSPEFASRIAAMLDREFAARGRRTSRRADAAVHGRSRRVLRATVAVAATLAGIALIGSWAARPAYSWNELIKAIEEQGWWQVAETGAAGTTRETWASSVRRVYASRSGKESEIIDGRANTHVVVAADTGETTIAPGRRTASSVSTAVRFYAALVSDADSLATDELNVVDRGWSMTADAQGRELVDLRVEVTAGSDRRELAFQIDPRTKLPVSCEISHPDSGDAAPRTVALSFPDEGPTTIYELGVADDDHATLAMRDAALALAGRSLQTPVAGADAGSEPAASESAEAASEIDDRSTDDDQPLQVVAREIRDVRKPTGDDVAAAGNAATAPHPTLQLGVLRKASETPDLPALLDDADLVQQLDGILEDHWRQIGIAPVEAASDGEFMRRAYLDLTGRIPTVSEALEFYESSDPQRRQALVDRLLASRDHATHLAAVWRRMLLPADVDLTQFGGAASFDEWLAGQFAENRPYDGIVRDLLTAEGRLEDSGPLLFYAALKLNPEELAARTSRAFLGVRMDCAQCHDHPFDDVAQQEFWGLAAFFARISRPAGKMEMTSPVLRVRDVDFGEVTLPGGGDAIAPQFPGLSGQSDSVDLDGPRRRQLAEWMTAPHNQQFARATVNRTWALLFGRGLVVPVDDMRPDNEAISPAALDLLAEQFASSGYDLRRLLRVLTALRAYGLSSAAAIDEPARTLNFAQMNLKSFTAEQLYDCIAVATRRRGGLEGGVDENALLRTGNSLRDSFIQQFSAPGDEPTDYQAGIPQALTLMHGQLIASSTDLASSGLLKSLAAPFFSNEQRIETLFLATLSRKPRGEELAAAESFVSQAEDATERQQALGDLLWALLNSAEFAFNH